MRVLIFFFLFSFSNYIFGQGLERIQSTKVVGIKYVKEFKMGFHTYPDSVDFIKINEGIDSVDFSLPENVMAAAFTKNKDFFDSLLFNKKMGRYYLPDFPDYNRMKLIYKFSYINEGIPTCIIGGMLYLSPEKAKNSILSNTMVAFEMKMINKKWGIIFQRGVDNIDGDIMIRLIKGQKGNDKRLNDIIDTTRCNEHGGFHLSKVFSNFRKNRKILAPSRYKNN